MLNVPTAFGDELKPGWPVLPPDQRPAEQGSVLRSPLLIAHIVSLNRLVIGFVASVVMGMLLGVLMWRSEELDRFFGPVFLGVQTLPSVCWVPLAIAMFGLSEQAILFVLIMGSVCATALAFRDGLRTIPPVYKKAGIMLGARGWSLYRYVLLPASLPPMTSTLRQGFTFAWRSLMGGEFVLTVNNHGLGFLLELGKNMNDVAQVIAVMIFMILIGMFADRLFFAPLERRVYRQFGFEVSS